MQENSDIFHYKMFFQFVCNFSKIKPLGLEFPCLLGLVLLILSFGFSKDKFYTLSYTCCHDNDHEFILWSRDVLCASRTV